MAPHPKRVDAFLAWSKLMAAQAIVPERVSHKGGNKPSGTRNRKRRKRRIRRNRRKRHNRVFKE